tara:strand:- start:9044 stop:9463 length:420 start_codon:yes stop_codon:yes gene_type:complete
MTDEAQEKLWEVKIQRIFRNHLIEWRPLVTDLEKIIPHIEQMEGLFGTAPPMGGSSGTARPAQASRPTASPEQPSTANQQGMTLYCPEHEGIQLRESLAKYQVYDEVDGQQIAAKYYCPKDDNGTDQNHNVWRSQAIVG